MKCPGCGFENLPGADTCENCAGSLTLDDVPQAGTEVERSLMEDPVECLHPIRPLTVDCSTSLTDAIQLMRNHKIGGLPVMDGDKLVGIITETDALDYLIQLLEKA